MHLSFAPTHNIAPPLRPCSSAAEQDMHPLLYIGKRALFFHLSARGEDTLCRHRVCCHLYVSGVPAKTIFYYLIRQLFLFRVPQAVYSNGNHPAHELRSVLPSTPRAHAL